MRLLIDWRNVIESQHIRSRSCWRSTMIKSRSKTIYFSIAKKKLKKKLKLKINLRKNIEKFSTIIENLNNQFMKTKNFRRKAFAFAFAISFEIITKRFTKILDLSLFSDKKTMLVSQWINKMKNKLFANVDHFETKKIKMIYVKNKTKKNAAKHLNFRIRENSFCFFSI